MHGIRLNGRNIVGVMMRRSRGVPARVSPGGGVGERWNGYRTVDHVRLDRQQRAHLPQLTLLVIGQTPVDPRFVGRVGEILFMDAQALLACQSNSRAVSTNAFFSCSLSRASIRHLSSSAT